VWRINGEPQIDISGCSFMLILSLLFGWTESL
jgi:hypothetical protein